MNLPSIDFSQLELREVGSWPRPLRIALIALAGLLGIVVVYFLLLSSQFKELDLMHTQQDEKRKEFKEKYGLAANLDSYKEQMVQIQDAYKVMLKQLPDSSHVPELIDSISRIAANDNLKFQSIKPGDPKSVLGFYKELPIDIDVFGNYHSFGKFVSDISKLSRIVTLHDFTIKGDKSQNGNNLSMKITAKTYWLSEEPEAKEAPAAGKKTSNTKTKANPTGGSKVAPPGASAPGQAPNIPGRGPAAGSKPGSTVSPPGVNTPGAPNRSPIAPTKTPGSEEL